MCVAPARPTLASGSSLFDATPRPPGSGLAGLAQVQSTTHCSSRLRGTARRRFKTNPLTPESEGGRVCKLDADSYKISRHCLTRSSPPLRNAATLIAHPQGIHVTGMADHKRMCFSLVREGIQRCAHPLALANLKPIALAKSPMRLGLRTCCRALAV